MKLFISYSRFDKPWVTELWQKLRNEDGHDAWMDKQIVPASDWWHSILTAIEDCECFVYVMSPQAVKSIYCLAEFRYALALNKPILPLMLRDCSAPKEIHKRRIQFHKIGEDNLDRTLRTIARSLLPIGIQIAQGAFDETPNIKRPDEPTPKLNPMETMQLAEEALLADNYSLAMSFLQQVIDGKDKIFAPTAQKRLTAIMDEQAKAEARKNIELMAGNSMLAEVARHAYEEYVKQYGQDEALEETLGIRDETDSNVDVEQRHVSSLRASPTTQTKNDPLEEAIERARNFDGTRNSDWTPFFHTFEVKGLELEMCLVPRGHFMMGSDDGEDDEKPVHEQVIDEPFWIGVHPITNVQYRQAVELSNGVVKVPDRIYDYDEDDKRQHPVVGVTWYQCRDFVRWLGQEWALPTEVQWEYSARGIDNLVYPFGNKFEPDLVVYERNSERNTAEVGGRPKGASWVGAQDMAGNVWDWTASLHNPYPYQRDDGRENMTGDGRRVLRGGSFFNYYYIERSSVRNSGYPDYRFSRHLLYLGFRIVLSPISGG